MKYKNLTRVLAGLSILATSFNASIVAGHAETTTEDALNNIRQKIAHKDLKEQDFQQLADLIAKDPKNAEPYAVLGKCYDIIGMRDMARQQYAVANSLDPSRAVLVLETFHERYRKGDPAESFDDWVQIRKRFADDKDVADFETAVARVYGTVSAAEQAQQQELSHGHTLRSIDAMLSVMESKRGNFVRANELANYDMKKHVTNECILAKGIALNGMGKYDAAQFTARAGWRQNFMYNGAAQQLAKADIGLGQYKEALVPAMVNLPLWDEPNETAEAVDLLVTALKHVSSDAVNEALKDQHIQFVREATTGPTFNTLLAEALNKANKKAEAADVLTKCFAQKKLTPDGYAAYGDYLARNSKYRDALEAYGMAAFAAHENKQRYQSAQYCMARTIINHDNNLALKLKEWMRTIR